MILDWQQEGAAHESGTVDARPKEMCNKIPKQPLINPLSKIQSMMKS